MICTPFRTSLVLLASVLLGAAPPATPAPTAAPPSALDAALALVPKDAIAFVVVPSPKRASDDLQQCIDRMDRPEAAVAGRPIDQLKAYLKISAAFDDKGTAAVAQLARTEGSVPIAFVPVTDGDAFLAGNFTAAPDSGPDAWKHADGAIVFARKFEHHVLLSLDADAVRSFKPDEGIAARVRERLGERGADLLARGDLIAWAGPEALRGAADTAAKQEAPPGGARAEEFQNRATALFRELTDGVLIIDFDPLGLGIRSFARASDDSELGGLMKGGTNHASKFDRIPSNPFYGIARLDIDGLGGLAAVEKLLKAVPGGATLPAWLTASRDHVHALQFAVYPSKLGIATGGILNDALLVIESDKPEVVRDGIKQAILATEGESFGVKRTPTWTTDKELKGGGVADAFQIEETLAASGEQSGNGAISKLISQVIFGSRGFVGFVRPLPGAIAMTFSQRVDVLERAVATSAGGKSLADDGTIKSYRPWLIDGADVEAYLGVAQLGKLVQQLATMVPGGEGIPIPQIPATVEPIAFALEVNQGTAETATVIPTGVLTIFYDQFKRQMTERGPAPAADPKP